MAVTLYLALSHLLVVVEAGTSTEQRLLLVVLVAEVHMMVLLLIRGVLETPHQLLLHRAIMAEMV
jgi:hypothetical protein